MLYNNPTKSSADGGIKNVNLPLLAPTTSALVLPYSFSAAIPVLASIISLKSLSSFLTLSPYANLVFDLTSTTSNASCTALTFLYTSSVK